jgi:hypothetical protein
MLGVIRKLFVVEKQLLAGREHKLGAAIDALQYSVGKLHGRLPKEGNYAEIGHDFERLAVPVSLSSCVYPQQGPGPQQVSGKSFVCPAIREDLNNTITLRECRAMKQKTARNRPPRAFLDSLLSPTHFPRETPGRRVSRIGSTTTEDPE